jgi:hypothetical protein
MNSILNYAVAKFAKNGSFHDDFSVNHNWFNIIKNRQQQTQTLAVAIYGYIVNWFVPIRDKGNGRELQKFNGDKLQLTYQQIADKFGISKYNVKKACLLLQSLGLITLEFRIATINDVKMSNVLFIDLNYDEYVKSLGKKCNPTKTPNTVRANI